MCIAFVFLSYKVNQMLDLVRVNTKMLPRFEEFMIRKIFRTERITGETQYSAFQGSNFIQLWQPDTVMK